jgi:hypothetical protein
MTFQLQHTQNYSSSADLHTFFTYFFDTYLNGLIPWTVTAHPDASAFKRSLKLTYHNTFTNADFSLYYWVNWESATPTRCIWRHDATYTTVPGDLGTYTTQTAYTDALTNVGAVGRDFKIWQSSERADATLVTLGKRVVFFWPGATEWNLHPGIPVWDGTNCPVAKDVPFPYIGHTSECVGFWQGNYFDLPDLNSIYYMWPSNGFPLYTQMNGMYPDGAVITGSPWGGGGSRSPGAGMRCAIMSSATSDFGLMKTGPVGSSSADSRYIATYSQDGVVVQDSGTGNFWLRGGSSTSLIYSAWNFGTSEPTF